MKIYLVMWHDGELLTAIEGGPIVFTSISEAKKFAATHIDEELVDGRFRKLRPMVVKAKIIIEQSPLK